MRGITLEMIISAKQERVAISPEIKLYFDELIDILQRERSELFPNG